MLGGKESQTETQNECLLPRKRFVQKSSAENTIEASDVTSSLKRSWTPRMSEADGAEMTANFTEGGVDVSRRKMGPLVMARRSKEWWKKGQVLCLLKEDELETGARNLSNSVATMALLLPGLSCRDRESPDTNCTPSSVTLTLSSTTRMLLSARTDDVRGDSTCNTQNNLLLTLVH
ncbi:hypothetical protein EYF80_018301 [Liparis tanakae]|uniref:Uncharacterized protein n=1 Tax=Liparis tanakae TaxID=230148 RepID=A0A4Z2I0I5_9TELE|nr:hypothetical protein EYF80_018301 [Liparis tanakae]